jgi:hypothetical protein
VAAKANALRGHTREVLQDIEALQGALVDVETSERGYVITGEEEYLQPYEHGAASAAAIYQELRRLTADNPAQGARLDRLDPLMQRKLELARHVVAMRREQGFEASRQLLVGGTGKRTMDAIRILLADMRADEDRLLGERQSQVESDERWAVAIIIGGIVLALGIVTVNSILMIRNAGALRVSLSAIQEQEWLQSNLAALIGMLREEEEPAGLGRKALTHVAPLLSAAVGAISARGDDGRFSLLAGYALDRPERAFGLGEGVAGEAARRRRLIQLAEVPAGYLGVSSSVGHGEPCRLLAVPLLYRDQVEAVLELGGFQAWTPIQLTFIERAAESIAIALASARSLARIKELLATSQQQEEELRVQQEELTQTNEELEEQARLLAERNQQVEAANQGIEVARRELEVKAAQLAQSSKYKSEFLSNMSHELRTPLNSLLILSRQLYENPAGNLDEKQVRYARTIHSSGADLLNLINDILDLAKIESGTVELDVAELGFGDIVAAVERTMMPLAENKGIEFAIRLGDRLPASLRSDGMRLQQVLKNLLSNAFKFTPVESGRVARVTLSIDPVDPGWSDDPAHTGAAVAFAVTDTGIGIPEDKQQLIFEAFQQADGGVSRKYGGTGLGLSISRELARMLGGELRLVSTPGEGSTFTLYLPLAGATGAMAAAPPAPRPRPAQPAPAVTAAEPAPAGMVPDDRAAIAPGDRVALIVENDVAFARILVEVAGEHGFKAVVSLGGGAVLGLARELHPTAITLDIHLADGNGWHLLDQLKHDPATRHIPVHVITIDEERERALRLGAHGVLTKPASREALQGVFAELASFAARRSRRLLVVEDSPVERDAIIEAIGNGDVIITAVADGNAALAALADGPVDCIVLDLGLPGMSGQRLLDALHAEPAWRDIPVIIDTARDLSAQDELQLRRNAKTIVLKTATSLDRLVDETTLFLHRDHSRLPPARQQRIERGQQADPALAGRTILVVDDDVRNVFALTGLLERYGMAVLSAGNGREALERLRADPAIAAVLMDLMMPEMDGHAAMRAIRAEPKWKDLPVIALTAKAMKGDREQCLASGASDYITKPVDSDRLLSMLRVWLYR